MSDGNTLIGNAMVGHAMDTEVGTTKGETYLAGDEEIVIAQEEERIMSGEVTSEEDEKVEQHMLTVALVNSVVETSAPQSPATGGNKSQDESKQRYSLRKRRRSGASLERPSANPGTAKAAQTKRPPIATTKQSAPITPAPASLRQPTTASKQPIATPIVKTEAVPACTVAVAAAPLPVPLGVASVPKASSLPPALQPPLRPKIPPMPSPRAPAAATTARTNDKSKRLVPATRVIVSSQPLTPNPAATGVPNPLINPLPASNSPSMAGKEAPENATLEAAPAFKAGTKLTVPCPLPPATFENNVQQGVVNRPPPTVKFDTEPVQEKKKVTIAPDLPPSRGRIFSIDLDPASLDFSVLDTGESGTPAPASADLPLVTGGGRDRAFSFECFAFGINADEPLPPLGAEHETSDPHQHLLPRPRGDSIIFDPTSFQEGGIHEERALKTRESRGLSIDLNTNADIIPSAPPAQDSVSFANHPGSVEHGHAPASVASMPAAPANQPPPTQPHPVPHSTLPDSAPSSVRMGVAQHPHHHARPHASAAPPPHHHHPGAYHHHAPPPGSNAVVPNPAAPPAVVASSATGSAVSIIGSCASSTTLQMELLNKDGRIGIYLPEARKERIARFHAKRKMRIWRKRIKYDCRKKLADSRPRIKGRFVKRTDND
ncbi:CCT motif family protein [Seminavis robusta]|uniref:CCT motif family protein n=1 Tax=Seminavis robusta TaxID=568900 RepID=A0A9N8DZD8_9STRA|nr:CCT motif family protein [Seminavis robusta]|eukprot:Sro362_g126700.1 CCT motif family protein (660) ;mRNA; f:16084-18166